MLRINDVAPAAQMIQGFALMIYSPFGLMIYNPYGIDEIHTFGVMMLCLAAQMKKNKAVSEETALVLLMNNEK